MRERGGSHFARESGWGDPNHTTAQKLWYSIIIYSLEAPKDYSISFYALVLFHGVSWGTLVYSSTRMRSTRYTSSGQFLVLVHNCKVFILKLLFN